MNLRRLIELYQNEGYNMDMSSSRVCQDIILKAIADGPLNKNVTIKGGVIMQNITNDNRRTTKDIDIDFIHYSIEDDSIKEFIRKLNIIKGIKIEIDGMIEELSHQDYHGKRVKIRITDDGGYTISTKLDIGVHKHFDIKQEECCFDVCMSEEGVSLLKNTIEQSFAEKLRSLLIFGFNSRRYKDVYDMYYDTKIANVSRLKDAIKIFIFDDDALREKDYNEIFSRLKDTFENETYINRVSNSKQRWFDDDIHIITNKILAYIKSLGEQ